MFITRYFVCEVWPECCLSVRHGRKHLGVAKRGENTKEWLTLRSKLVTVVLLLLFNCPVGSDSLWLHGLQHTRLPCPSPTSGACSNSCLLSWWCHPTILSFLSPSPPAFNLFQYQGLFQWVGSLHQVAKVLELQLQFSIGPSNEYSGLISFRIGWFDLLAVQVTLKNLLQHHSSNASILSAFFTVQLSHLYITIG